MFKVLALALLAEASKLFIVPHSHTDLGWLKTVEEYYNAKVRDVLNNYLILLDEIPDLKFSWSETGFLKMWMEEQPQNQQIKMKKYIQEGRIEIVGGGFVQNDEANSDWENVLRQMELGRRYMKEQFGVESIKVGWQLDPFGYSALTPSLWAQMGYEYLVINRIDYSLKKSLRTTGKLEFVWEGTNFGENYQMFTHVLYEHYSSPKILHPFESSCFGNVFPNYKSQEMIARCQKGLVDLMETRSKGYRTENIMVLFGDDFWFSDLDKSQAWLRSLNAVVNHMNNQGYSVQIATPSEYFEAVKTSQAEFPIYKGDFFPYMSDGNNYWTGYYTTRPGLKKSIYSGHKIAREAEIAGGLVLKTQFNAEAASIGMHHDAVTGTCRPHVAQDYRSKLSKEYQTALEVIQSSYNSLLRKTGESVQASKVGVVFNSLSWEVESLEHFTSETEKVQVRNCLGEILESQAVPFEGKFLIYFKIKAPPLSFSNFFVNSCNNHCAGPSVEASKKLLVENEVLKINFDQKGFIKSIQEPSKTIQLNSKFWEYKASKGGAYKFHPDNLGKEKQLKTDLFKIYSGNLVDLVFSKWTEGLRTMYQKVVLPKNSDTFTWQIGVNSKEDEELFLRMQDNSTTEPNWFYTFNSGDVRLRTYTHKTNPGVVGKNYYPISGGLIIKPKLQIFPSFPLGAGLVDNSTFELHLHRNPKADDNFGLQKPIQDTEFINHEFHVRVGNFNWESLQQTYLGNKNKPLVVFAKGTEPVEFVESYQDGQSYDEWPYYSSYLIAETEPELYLSTVYVIEGDVFYRLFNHKNKTAPFEDYLKLNMQSSLSQTGWKVLGEIEFAGLPYEFPVLYKDFLETRRTMPGEIIIYRIGGKTVPEFSGPSF